MKNFYKINNQEDVIFAASNGLNFDLTGWKDGDWLSYLFKASEIIYHTGRNWNNKRYFLIGEDQELSLNIDNGKIISLYLRRDGFSSFSFIEHFHDLEELYFGSVPFEKIELIKSNAPIRVISIYGGYKEVKGDFKIRSLSGCQNLEKLVIREVNIQDFEAISNFPNLKDIDIMISNITSLTPLKYLNNLESLGLWQNKVEDISPIRHLIEKGIPVILNNHPVEEWGMRRKAIALSASALRNPPAKIVAMGNWAILEYFDGRRDFPGKIYNWLPDREDEPISVEVPFEILNLGKEEVELYLRLSRRARLIL